MNWKKWLRGILIVILAPFALLLIAQWTSAWWLDLSGVKGQITRIIDNATGGTGRYGHVDIRIFPRPRAIITGVRFGLPGTLDVEASSVTAAIRLLPLFRGRVDPYQVELIAPRIRLVLADTSAAAPPKPPGAPLTLPALDSGVRNAVRTVANRMPGLTVLVDSGRLELTLGRRAPIVVEHLDVRADVASTAMNASVSFTSSVIERFTARLRVASADLAGNGEISITGIRAPALAEAIGAGAGWPVDSALVDARIGLSLNGLRDARVEIGVSAPRVVLHVGKGRLAASGLTVAITARRAGDSITVALDRLKLADPAMEAHATLARDRAGELSLDATLGDLDLRTMQAVANGLAPGVSFLQGLPVTIGAGTLTAVTLHARAKDLGSLFALPAMEVTGALNGVDADITAFHDLPVRGVNAGFSLVHGVLGATALRASADGLPVHDGRYRIDLNADVPPMSGGAVVDVALADALVLAPRYLPPSAVAQIHKVHDLRGHVTAAVQLNGNVNEIVPSVVVSNLQLSARYDTIPFPVRLTRGTIAYTPSAIAVHALGGFIGTSSFSGLTARLSLTGPSVVSATEGTVQLALPELFDWALKQPKLAKSLDSVRSVGGKLSVSIQQLALPLDSVKQLTFQATATPLALEADAPAFAPRVRLDGGTIRVTEKSIDADSIGITALDARLLLSGRTGDYRARIDSAYGSVTGTLGPEALRWGFTRAKLDSTLRLSAAVDIAAASAEWHRDGAVRAAGSVAVRGGPAVDFTIHTKGELIDVERARLHDAESDATITARLEGAHFRTGCDGHIAGASIGRLFAQPPLELRQLQCAFRAEGDFKKPEATTATGVLSASRIRLPPMLPIPVTIDALDIAALGTTLEVRTLRLSSGPSRVDVTGSVKVQGDQFVVDADVRGDTVIIPSAPTARDTTDSAARANGKAGGGPISREQAAAQQSKFYKSLREMPATGAVRVRMGLVKFQHFEIAPLVATASIAGSRASFTLQDAALCGVSLSGGLTLVPDSVHLSGALHAKNIAVERTVNCFTDERIDLTGTANIDASFVSRAPMGQLRDRVTGTLTLTAKDGRINKFDALANALKVVNSTQVLVGQASDLGTKGMAYSKVQVKVEMSGLRVDVKEFSLDATGFEAAAHGRVDLDRGTIDFDALIAPIQTANWVISHIPIVRDIFGGTVLAVPVKIRGTMDKPVVVPLGAEAVGSRLAGILGNTLKLPTKLVPASTPKDTTKAAPSKPPPSNP